MQAEQNRKYDGFLGLLGGIDSGRSPNEIRDDQASFAVNVTFRGGKPKTRPGFARISLTFEGDSKEWFEGKNIQGSLYYAPTPATAQIIVCVGGKLFKIAFKGRSGTVSEITPSSGRNSQYSPHAFMVQADAYCVIQDGVNKPIIYNGAISRRAEDDEVPIGTAMAFGAGRLWVANGKEFVAGDIVNGPTSVLKFTENDYLNEGGAFALAVSSGTISGMTFISQQDTATGQGELLVFGTNGVASVFASTFREDWKTTDIQRVALENIGATSHSFLVNANGDVFFRASDGGIRSYRMARAEEGGWGRTPLSRELDRVLAFDTQRKLDFASGVFFDNRLLFTVNPVPTPNGAYHKGLGVLDFHPLSGMQSKAPACWEGIWTGINAVSLVAGQFHGEDRCFAFSRCDDTNALWEITKSDRFDNQDEAIESQLELRALQGQNPYELKRLVNMDLWVSDLVGETTFNVKFRTDQYPCWVDWKTFTRCASYETCSVTACGNIPNLQPQYRPQIRLTDAPEDCDSVLKKPQSLGFEVQPKITWTGHARLDKARVKLEQVPEELQSDCVEDGDSCVSLDCCPGDDYSYGCLGGSDGTPTAYAGDDETFALVIPLDLILGGEGSDPDFDIVTFTWTQLSGPAVVTFTDPNIADPTATFPVAGVYELQLQVSDGVNFAYDTVTYTIN